MGFTPQRLTTDRPNHSLRSNLELPIPLPPFHLPSARNSRAEDQPQSFLPTGQVLYQWSHTQVISLLALCFIQEGYEIGGGQGRGWRTKP